MLETPRLRLRPYRADDAEAMFALYSDPRVMRYWSFPPWTEVGPGARLPGPRPGRTWIPGDIFPWAIADARHRPPDRRADPVLAARRTTRAEIGYSLSPGSPGTRPGRRSAALALACAIDSLGLRAHRGRHRSAQRAVRAAAGKTRLPARRPAAQALAGQRRSLRHRVLRLARRGIRPQRSGPIGAGRQ